MIHIGILTITTNVYGSRRILRYGFVLSKKKKGFEEKIMEKYRKAFETKMQEVGIPASACKLSFNIKTTPVTNIDIDFY